MKKQVLAIGLSVLGFFTLHAQPKTTKATNSSTVSGNISNLVTVRNLWDLPPAFGNAITLDPTKVYQFGGIIDISPNHINLNGASIVGTDPSRDGVMSSVNGAIIRSQDVEVFMEKIAIIPLSPKTTALDLVDNTSTKFCNLFSGCSVVEAPRVTSGGVGSITGFNAVYMTANYWRCSEGLKIKGKTGKFCGSYNYMTGISIGAAIELMPDFTASDVDLSNNYFVYSGSIGVRLNQGAVVDQGRVAGNLFRGVSSLLVGFDSHTPG
jgi:hypothetical protein